MITSTNPVSANTALVSYYGHDDNFGGRKTSSGEIFNPYGWTAAHKTLPKNTRVKFSYKGNSVVVRINDKGPYSGNRSFDLSYASMKAIGAYSKGVATVEYTIVSKDTPLGPIRKIKAKKEPSPNANVKLANIEIDTNSYLFYPYGLWMAQYTILSFSELGDYIDYKDTEEA